MEPKKIEFEADFLSVLAQPTRLKILYFLRDGEKCACKINPYMQEDASVISRHLVKMREAGILDSRKEGVWIHYRIKEPRVFQILKIIDDILLSAAQEKAQEFASIS
ncbi:MAG: winged helix-turn-helix transcriptional regulator [candidate division Zixibacteria bacterium]|nr:winged helix-turn-helix transcriptional regulator [Candidatus Tariuqbacter arcticus]